MKLLFSFIVPSGGMETLNRYRCKALRLSGIECHLHYQEPGSGLQNIRDIPTFITNSNTEIQHILQRESYDAIIVTSDYVMLKKIRQLGFGGALIYEVMGLGTPEKAQQILVDSIPIVSSCANAILHPLTTHLFELFLTYYPNFRRYCFHPLIDFSDFCYRSYPTRHFPIIAWVGRFENNKNWKGFLDIGKRLIEQNPSTQLYVFDDASICPEQQQFFDYMVSLGITGNITRYYNVPHSVMADYLSIIGDSGGFLCSTSKTEGFGYTVLEAMSCLCPVLTTDSDGVRSLITHNVTGKFFHYDDTDQALQEANELLYNHALRNSIRSQAYQHVTNTFSLNAYVTHFSNMLNDLFLG
jgi:glycosyltransferase involved in cell wall biosynthesis